MFEYSLVAGLTASGADAYLLHVTTTPSVSRYGLPKPSFDCGIMISASHNPFYDNGIKVITTASGTENWKPTLEAQASKPTSDDGNTEDPPSRNDEKTSDAPWILQPEGNRYIGHLTLDSPTKSFKNMRVGPDCSNGSASSVAKSVFDAHRRQQK